MGPFTDSWKVLNIGSAYMIIEEDFDRPNESAESPVYGNCISLLFVKFSVLLMTWKILDQNYNQIKEDLMVKFVSFQ